jgi:hypothetical protein
MKLQGFKRSALVGALRGYILLAVIHTLSYEGIGYDTDCRGSALGLDYHTVSSLRSSTDIALFLAQLGILAPLACLLGALLGVVFDRMAQTTPQPKLRMIQKIVFPILFFFIFNFVSAQLFLVQEAKPFDAHSWRTVMFVDRRALVDDLISHHKLKSMTVQEAEDLLGPPDKDAEPWYRIAKHPDTPCLAYDMGKITFKYGMCLALYYDKDKKIDDFEITRYKYW